MLSVTLHTHSFQKEKKSVRTVLSRNAHSSMSVLPGAYLPTSVIKRAHPFISVIPGLTRDLRSILCGFIDDRMVLKPVYTEGRSRVKRGMTDIGE